MSYLAMGKPMKNSTVFHLVAFKNDLSVSTSGGSCHNIFVKRERNEDDDCKKIHYSADGTHGFGSIT